MGLSSREFAQLHRERATFYQQQSAVVRDRTARKLLEYLAQEERDMADAFLKKLSAYSFTGFWPVEVSDVELAEGMARSMAQLRAFTPGVTRADDSVRSALDKAIALKTESTLFFSQLIPRHTTAAELELFFYLEKQDRNHMISMKESQAYLEDPCAWVYPL